MINANPSCGAGEGITVPCCPNPIPATLFATIETAGMYCACLNGAVVPLARNEATNKWEGSKSLCGKTVSIKYYCMDEAWFLDFAMGCTTDDSGVPIDPVTCDPLHASGTLDFTPACCGETDFAGNIEVTITE